MRPSKIACLWLILMSLTFITSVVRAAPTAPSESELYNQAYDLSLRKDYAQAVGLLRDLLQLYPDTTNEEVYWKLAQIYDESLYDYENALEVYRVYLAEFPAGRFYDGFQSRIRYLSGHRSDWQAIRDYKKVTDTSYTRLVAENINMMLDWLKTYPATVVTPDAYNWLATQYQQTGQNKQAEVYIKKYLATFPGNEKTNNDIIIAYEQYATILANQKHYRAAMTVLKETLKYQIDPYEYSENVKVLQKELRLWIGLIICFTYISLFLLLLLSVRPWRYGHDRFEPARMAGWCFLFMLGALAPFLCIYLSGRGIWKSFYWLALTSPVSLFLTRLGAPLAAKFGRAFYLICCFLLICAGVYLAFYCGDTLSVFYQKMGA